MSNQGLKNVIAIQLIALSFIVAALAMPSAQVGGQRAVSRPWRLQTCRSLTCVTSFLSGLDPQVAEAAKVVAGGGSTNYIWYRP